MLKLKTKTMKTKLDMHNRATKGEPLSIPGIPITV